MADHHCGRDNHHMRSCALSSAVDGAGEIILFGVRVKVDPLRKSVSLNNLSQYDYNKMIESTKSATALADEGYASADDAVLLNQPTGGRERKRGVPWTEEEHKLFLLGLQKVGKGDWRGISRNFVKTRTPTQVASHAQKYFLRRSNLNRRRRRRSSLFDITTDSVTPMLTEEQESLTANSTPGSLSSPLPISELSQNSPFAFASTPEQISYSVQQIQVEEKPIRNLTTTPTDEHSDPSAAFILPVPVPHLNNPSTRIVINLNESVEMEPSSLSLSLSLPFDQTQTHSSRHHLYPAVSSLNSGDSIIAVA
ncbi:unnamed protein product [Cuscuta epithymum]|uniref:Uncharacterized protein n=2 Tax=Cuscuta epithymum TaxID=186058 RepID=A0AAV0GFX1_9ASTE|nr:unnamed protein product [Cuscuta epithymum]